MARDGAKWYRDEGEWLSDEGYPLRRERSARDKNKKRKASTIRQGIEHYYVARQNQGGYGSSEFDDRESGYP